MSKEHIDREEVIKILEHYDLSSGLTLGCHSGAIECAISAIEMLPAADVVPVVHGEWIERALRPTCSLCGFGGSLIDVPISPFKYCPNCGAKMDKEEK
jgi:hypothetical protein